MKVVFVDVDGVLNNAYTKAEAPSGAVFVSDSLVNNLAKIVNKTGAKVVLSSSWRYEWIEGQESKDFIALREKLREFGIELFDKTPKIGSGGDREKEIREWLNLHCDVTKFVVLDDESYLFSSMDGLILADYFFGLTDEVTSMAICKLMED